MFNTLRRTLAPRLDPPDREGLFERRPLTRDRTPWQGPDEYVCTVDHHVSEVREALAGAGYSDNHLSTLKYVVQDGDVSWEVLSMATNRWDWSCEECQHHCYAFRGQAGVVHLHHHREYPVVQFRNHQRGDRRTHGDPDGTLRRALADAGIDHYDDEDPAYRPTEP